MVTIDRSRLPEGLSVSRNALGPVFFRDQYFPLDHRHGRFRLESALKLPAGVRTRLREGLTKEHIRQAAFLDIETGARTETSTSFAFLVGIGTFDSFSFRVRQYFLGEPDAERAMLAAIVDTLQRCRCVVTFNGRIFDLPQLSARLQASRLPDPFASLPHVDLLIAARNLYSESMNTRRLSEIEAKLIGFRRRNDLPGSAIPDLYSAYLARRRPSGLHPVFRHNCRDVLSLPAFLAFLARDGDGDKKRDARHRLATGRWDDSASRPAQAIAHYRAAWELDQNGLTGGEALQRLMRLLARSGDWRQRLSLWQTELERTGRRDRKVRACIELAKLHERYLREPAAALRFALQARQLILTSPSPQAYLQSAADLDRRIPHLEKRLGRQRLLSSKPLRDGCAATARGHRSTPPSLLA